MTTQIAVRLPDDLVAQLDTLVEGGHQSRSEAIRRAIGLYVYRLASERDARRYDDMPLTASEFAMADEPAARSGTPAGSPP
jgi:Arc/MetJ-type ribon-helix-helix transcriptional regulator